MVKYAVGQPMGAYSSFAMLALTHHVIVHIAALRTSVHPKRLIYMVLGDDGAMANSKVANAYKCVFSELGLEINPLKGFEGTVLEFAKQLWTINGINLSPIGPKNIMLALRHVEFLPSVLHEIWVKKFPLFINYILPLPSVKETADADWTRHISRSYVASRRPEFANVISNRVVSPQLVAKQFEPGQSDPNSPHNYKDISSAPSWLMGRLAQVTIPLAKAPKIVRNVFKRTEDGVHQVCMISASSLFRLVSAVHFQSGKKGKVVK